MLPYRNVKWPSNRLRRGVRASFTLSTYGAEVSHAYHAHHTVQRGWLERRLKNKRAILTRLVMSCAGKVNGGRIAAIWVREERERRRDEGGVLKFGD